MLVADLLNKHCRALVMLRIALRISVTIYYFSIMLFVSIVLQKMKQSTTKNVILSQN